MQEGGDELSGWDIAMMDPCLYTPSIPRIPRISTTYAFFGPLEPQLVAALLQNPYRDVQTQRHRVQQPRRP